MTKIDRTLILLAITLQVTILARMGGFIGTASAYDQDPPRLERWYSKPDSWQEALERMTKSLNEWADKTFYWNQGIERRLNELEKRVQQLEPRAPKKAVPRP